MKLSHLITFGLGAIWAVAVIGAFYYRHHYRMLRQAAAIHAQMQSPKLTLQIEGIYASSVPEADATNAFSHLKSVPTIFSLASQPATNLVEPVRIEIQFDQTIERCQFIEEDVLDYEVEKDTGAGHQKLVITVNAIKHGGRAQIIVTTARALHKPPLLSFSPKNALVFANYGFGGYGVVLDKKEK
jgi:hypothetical protein